MAQLVRATTRRVERTEALLTAMGELLSDTVASPTQLSRLSELLAEVIHQPVLQGSMTSGEADIF